MLIPEVRQAPEASFTADIFKERFDTDSIERVFGWEDKFPYPFAWSTSLTLSENFSSLIAYGSVEKAREVRAFRGLRMRSSTVPERISATT
jgi:hypothetical protein